MNEERRVLEIIRAEFWAFNAFIMCRSTSDAILLRLNWNQRGEAHGIKAHSLKLSP
jgi:hypothetical protein